MGILCSETEKGADFALLHWKLLQTVAELRIAMISIDYLKFKMEIANKITFPVCFQYCLLSQIFIFPWSILKYYLFIDMMDANQFRLLRNFYENISKCHKENLLYGFVEEKTMKLNFQSDHCHAKLPHVLIALQLAFVANNMYHS